MTWFLAETMNALLFIVLFFIPVLMLITADYVF
jgi:hypothetical protein